MTSPNGARSLRIAIAGLGPKGTFALERLLDQAARRRSVVALEVVAFEPHPTPGAGPVYDPVQPAYLRMNFSAEQVDIWPPDSRAAPDAERLSFADWRSRGVPGGSAEPYAPRAEVGRYLTAGLDALRRHAPPEIEISIRREAVVAVHPGKAEWLVETDAGAATFDEVLVATGHSRGWDGAMADGWAHAVPLVDGVFPVSTQLTPARIPPGSRVAARGYALTFIDAALALTEGRGGSFEPTGGGSALRYRRSGAEPARILPFSRTGKPMLAKPDPGARAESERWRRTATDARERIIALPAGFSIGADLVSIVDAVARAGGPGRDCDHARGAAWRAVYPAIVARLGGDGLSDGEWPAFRALAAEMERLAFGPPTLNVRKLEALVEAGVVDPAHAAGGRIETTGRTTELRSDAGGARIDVALDAVLAPPGAIGVDSPLLRRLIDQGLARIRPGRRGLDVTEDATCVAAGGRPSVGLAACGRPTEDSVIGNDTLSRALHPQLERWAARVVERATIGAPIPIAVRA